MTTVDYEGHSARWYATRLLLCYGPATHGAAEDRVLALAREIQTPTDAEEGVMTDPIERADKIAREAIAEAFGFDPAAQVETSVLRIGLRAIADAGLLSGAPQRCPSCEHRISMHTFEGCVQEIAHGPNDEPDCCPCAVVSGQDYASQKAGGQQ